MSSTFVRVSVLHDDQQLDVSLPVNRPVIDYIDDVISLLTEAPKDNEPNRTLKNTHIWVMSSPTRGIIEPYLTLADREIVDGERLYLTRRHEAAHSPFVDDALAEVRSTIGDAQWRWFEKMRAGGLIACTLVLLSLLAVGASLTLLTTPAESLSTLVTGRFGVSAAIIGFVSLFAFGLAIWRPQQWLRWAGMWLPVAVAVISAPFLIATPVWWCAAILAAAIPATAVAGRKQPVGAVAGITALVIGTIVLSAVALGLHFSLNLIAIAAWSAWLPVLLLLLAPTAALKATGLATILRRNDAGDQVSRDDIRAKALRSEAISRGIVWSAIGIAVGILVILSASGFWQHGTIAALLSVVLLLRTNGFADARVIVPLLFSGVLGFALTVGAAVSWAQAGWVGRRGLHPWWLPGSDSSWLTWFCAAAVIIIATIIMIVAQFRAPDDLAEAKLAKVISTIDVLVCLAVIPVILAAQGVFVYYWATF